MLFLFGIIQKFRVQFENEGYRIISHSSDLDL